MRTRHTSTARAAAWLPVLAAIRAPLSPGTSGSGDYGDCGTRRACVRRRRSRVMAEPCSIRTRDVATEVRRAAALDGQHHLQLAEAHMAAVGIARHAGGVLRHDAPPLSRKMPAISRAGRATVEPGYLPGSSSSSCFFDNQHRTLTHRRRQRCRQQSRMVQDNAYA